MDFLNDNIDGKLARLYKQIDALEHYLEKNTYTEMEKRQVRSELALCYRTAIDLLQKRDKEYGIKQRSALWWYN